MFVAAGASRVEALPCVLALAHDALDVAVRHPVLVYEFRGCDDRTMDQALPAQATAQSVLD